MICPDCKGSKVYVGLMQTEPCRTCCGTEMIGVVSHDYQLPMQAEDRLARPHVVPEIVELVPTITITKPADPGIWALPYPLSPSWAEVYRRRASPPVVQGPGAEVTKLISTTYGTAESAKAWETNRRELDEAVVETAASLIDGIDPDEIYQAQAAHQRRLALIELARLSIGNEENEDCDGLEGIIPEPLASKLIADWEKGNMILIPLHFPNPSRESNDNERVRKRDGKPV